MGTDSTARDPPDLSQWPHGECVSARGQIGSGRFCLLGGSLSSRHNS